MCTCATLPLHRQQAVAEYHSLIEAAQKERTESRERSREWSEQIAALQEEGKAVHARMNATYEVLKVFEAKRDASRKDWPTLQTRRQQLRELLNKEYADLKAVNQERYLSRQAYHQYQVAVREARDAERKAGEKEERLAREKLQADVDAEAATHHPWEAELSLCNLMENYMRNLVGRPPIGSEPVTSPSAGGGAAGGAGGGAAAACERPSVASFGKAVGKGAKEEDDWMNLRRGGKKGKKGRKEKNGKKGKKASIKLDLGTLSSLQLLGLSPPSTHEDAAALISAIQVKRKFYETAPPKKKGKKGRGAAKDTSEEKVAPAAEAEAGAPAPTPAPAAAAATPADAEAAPAAEAEAAPAAEAEAAPVTEEEAAPAEEEAGEEAGGEEEGEGDVALGNGDAVSTPYGEGAVKEVREDGSVVVTMTSFEAEAFLQADQVQGGVSS
jgi:hypothetical protein